MAVVAVVGASVVVAAAAAIVAVAVAVAVAAAAAIVVADDEKPITLNPVAEEEEEAGTLQWQFWPSLTSWATVYPAGWKLYKMCL